MSSAPSTLGGPLSSYQSGTNVSYSADVDADEHETDSSTLGYAVAEDGSDSDDMFQFQDTFPEADSDGQEWYTERDSLKRSTSLDDVQQYSEWGPLLKAADSNPLDKALGRVRTKVQNQRQRLSETLRKEAELIRRVGRAGKDGPKQARSVLRKVVTGDKECRVRDHFKQRVKEPRGVRLVDKLSFTIGVINLATTEWFLLVKPELFWAWFCFVIPSLVTLRHFMYKRLKFHYFLYDFCYYVQITCLTSIIFLPKCTWLWQANWAFANGPLLFAIVAWRNSLVFHSLDKITSVYIHAFPPLLMFAVRWWPQGGDVSHICDDPSNCSLSWFNGVGVPCMIYLSWQVLYFTKVEIFDRTKLNSDPNIQTSLRWFARDVHNPMYVGTLKVCRALGVMKRDEVFVAAELKTKLIFMITQFLFTVANLIPPLFFFSNFALHTGYIIVVFSWCVWQGANYYIEVFSRTYMKKFNTAADT